LNRRLGGPNGRSGHFEGEKNCLPLPRFDSRAVQPVAILTMLARPRLCHSQLYLGRWTAGIPLPAQRLGYCLDCRRVDANLRVEIQLVVFTTGPSSKPGFTRVSFCGGRRPSPDTNHSSVSGTEGSDGLEECLCKKVVLHRGLQ